MKPIRVLHCPTVVGGNPGQLARAEREVGLESVAVAFENSVYAYDVDDVLWRAGDRLARRELERWRLLLRAIRDFDVVHFNFGSSLMPRRVKAYGGPRMQAPLRAAYRLYAHVLELRDVAFLRKLGKGIVVTFQGDDARQGDVCRERYEISPASVLGYYTQERDEANRRAIAVFGRYADRIFALNPDLLAVLPPRAEFLPYASVDPGAWSPSFPESGDVLRVVHAPSHRGVKGTEHVLAAVERLRAENLPLELDLIERLTHAEARRLYARADIVVDQLLVGWYGGFAVEAMALGKPVIAYLRDGDLVHLPAEMRAELPVVSATPTTITDVLRRLATTERHRLVELGRRGRAYVEHWHHPAAIAERLKNTYELIMKRPR